MTGFRLGSKVNALSTNTHTRAIRKRKNLLRKSHNAQEIAEKMKFTFILFAPERKVRKKSCFACCGGSNKRDARKKISAARTDAEEINQT